MSRSQIFACDTILYHPITGPQLFPRGEQDPGAIWSENPGGDPVGGKTADAALLELAEANERIAAMGERQISKDHDLSKMAAERDWAVAKAKALQVQVETLTNQIRAFDPNATVPEVHDKRTLDTAAERQSALVPADWRTLKFFAKKALAAKLTDQPVNTMADVEAAIERHLAQAA